MNFFRDWHLIYGLLPRKDQRKIYALLALTTISGVIQVLGVVSVTPFIAVVANPEMVETNEYLNKAYSLLDFSSISGFLIFLGLLSAGILAASNAIITLTVWLTVRFCNMREFDLQKRLLESYLAQPYSVMLQRNTSELGKNVLGEVERVVIGSMMTYINLFADIVLASLLIGALLIVDPLITVITTAVLAAAYTIIFFTIRRRLQSLSREFVELGTSIFISVREALEGFKAIKILGRESFFVSRYSAPTEQAAKNAVAYSVLEFISGPLVETITFIVIVLITVYIVASAENTALILPVLAMFAFSAYRLVPALKSIFDGIERLTFNSPALNALRDDLQAARLPESADRSNFSLRKQLVCRDVGYSYPGDRVAGVTDINLTIPALSSLCIVGRTGAGKSTTVDLLLGLLNPDSGEILADDMPIHGTDVQAWQRKIGYVPQVIYLTDDSIERNIAFGVPDESIDHDKVIVAAKLAELHEFVTTSLPDQYKTIVGERGAQLSGGQRQRIGIARALYRDPEILILDEATNELDGKTEADIANALFRLADRTIIFSTHNQTIAKRCDKIVVMDGGRITAVGFFAELLEKHPGFIELMTDKSQT